MSWRSGVVIALLASACGEAGYVKLRPPAVGLSPEKRVEMFQQLRGVTETIRGNGGSRTMQLANGTQIEHPEDMLPALSPDSLAARQVSKYQRASHRARAYQMVALPLALGGVVVLGAGSSSSVHGGSETPVAIGVGLAVAGIIVLLVGHGAQVEANDAADAAYNSYNESLAKTLDLCISGVRIVACDDPNVNVGPPGETAPAAPGNTAPAGAAIDVR